MIWSRERNQQQGQLVAEIHESAAEVPAERVAVIAGGLPGADKAAALATADVDVTRYLTVSIDDILLRMAARELIPPAEDGDGQSPLGRADHVHREAQFVAKRVALLALTNGRNIILDISLASWRAAEAWTYALRFADYAVNAVFADIGIEDAVSRADEAYQAGEEDFRRGHGYGGRYPRAQAIRALAIPAAAEPRNRIRWAVGARSAGAIGGTVGTGTFPSGAVTSMLTAFRDGTSTLDDLSLEFRARRWPQVPDVCPPELEQARTAIDDPEPYVPGSFDDVVLAYDRGWLSDDEYEILSGAAAADLPGS